MKIKQKQQIKRAMVFRIGVFLCVMLIALCLSGCEKDDLEEELASEYDASGEAAYEELREEVSADSVGEIYVYVCGAVKSPGVYTLKNGSHVFEALEMAGGCLEGAAEDAVNQAALLSDGEQIKIPSKDEISSESEVSKEIDDGKVNINTATAEELTSLSGIGGSRAEAIIAYRSEHGSFKDIEDIKNVAGIKAGLYAKIKDYIKI